MKKDKSDLWDLEHLARGQNITMDKYFAFLFWSNLIFGITVFIFQRGFLLRREVLNDRTVCQKSQSNDSCYPKMPRQYSKAIVLIIDALRQGSLYIWNISSDKKGIYPYNISTMKLGSHWDNKTYTKIATSIVCL